jgi:glc operon protein GlcG
MPLRIRAAGLLLALSSLSALGQVSLYGPNVTLEQARKIYAAAEAEARRNNAPVAIAVVDTAGNLVLYQRLDNTQTASIRLAVDKAASAAIYRRSTRVFQESLARGGENLRILALNGAVPVEGGLPIFLDGRVIGGIGVSGAPGDLDNQIAQAGAKGL